MPASGTVVRFDRRRGYGFVSPEDGGEDVFVHQNNINMEGFRYLQVGEKVSYELEVGEKGMKAVSVTLTEPRQARSDDFEGQENEPQDPRDDRDAGYAPRMRESRPPRQANGPARRGDDAGQGNAQVEKLRRTQERLISLLVEKGILVPGELEGFESPAQAVAPQA